MADLTTIYYVISYHTVIFQNLKRSMFIKVRRHSTAPQLKEPLWCCTNVHEGFHDSWLGSSGSPFKTLHGPISRVNLSLPRTEYILKYARYATNVAPQLHLSGFNTLDRCDGEERPVLSGVFGPDPPSLQNRPKAA